MFRVEKVENRKQLREFVRFPAALYPADSPWVPPLWRAEIKKLDPQTGPFFQHSKATLFMARDESGQVAGRIAAIRFNRHLEVYNDGVGFFGFFECIENPQVTNRLFNAAAEWLRGEGLTTMRGPFSFTINDECGLLVEGFDDPPTVLTSYNPSYYPQLFEQAGFIKVEDLLARELNLAKVDDGLLKRMRKIVARNRQLSIRQVRLDRLEEEIGILNRIYDEAWRENWGAVPMSREEFLALARQFKPFLIPEVALIAEHAGQPVGICVMIPDLNVAVKAARGKLGLLGLVRFAVARRRIDRVRGVIMGVLKAYQNKGIESAYTLHCIEALKGTQYHRAEFSWMLESNYRVNRVIKRVGATLTKRWRIFEKPI